MKAHELLTGDGIFSSGDSPFSNLIKQSYGGCWSHMSMALWGRDVGIDDQLYVWEATGHGVGEVPFEKANRTEHTDFFTRFVNPGAGDVVVRQIVGLSDDQRKAMVARFAEHRLAVKGHPYEKNKKQMIAAVAPRWLRDMLHLAGSDDWDSMFCWECVCAGWKSMGLLPQERPANTYTPAEFMGDYKFLMGASLGPKEPLER